MLIETLKRAVAQAISEASATDIDAGLLEHPEDANNGDLAFPCFQLAKALKKAPPMIAADLASSLSSRAKPGELWSRVEAKGPYLNFFLHRDTFLGAVLAAPKAAAPLKGKNIMVEYVSPNNNKPLHLGHVRNGLIGEAVSNLLETQGHKVTRALLLNDRGLAIAKAMIAYIKWGEGATPETRGMKGDHFVAEYYVLYEKKLKEGEADLDEGAHEIIRKWEAGDAETRKLWKTMSAWCERGQHETYTKLGFGFDVEYKESDIYTHGKDIVEEGLKKGVFTKDPSGAVVAHLENRGLADKAVLRADGTSLYITQDLYLARKKFAEGRLDESIYVVGNEQNLHFKQLFKILELLGEPWAANLTHLSYGYVTLPEGRMKSREGTVVDADDLLASLEADAAIEVKQRYPTLPDDELVRRAKTIALAAVKFHFLEVDIASDMTYDPKASLSFTGKTGPYLQYMHARIRSILRKGEGQGAQGEAAYEGRNAAPEEHRLVMLVARYPETVRRAAAEFRPSLVAGHLYETAKAMASFYENCPVLNASKEDRAVRLKLIETVGGVLKDGLALLGIQAPEEM